MCFGVGKLLSSRDAPQELLGSGAHGNPKSRAQELSEQPTSPPNQVASARALGSFCPRPKSFSSAKAVADDETLLKVLDSVDFPDGDASYASTAARGPPKAPADRTLRETAEGVRICGGLYFTPDAQTLVYGSKELSLWDLCSSEHTNGGVKRDGGAIYASAVSPNDGPNTWRIAV